jgi:hypothetical protein
MSEINLKEARQRQIDKQHEEMVIPANTIDPVLYATIERDYSELLRIIIDAMSPILVPQFIYINGKSRSQGERDIKRMMELGLLGKSEWKGVDYLYPLRNAKAWRKKKSTNDIAGQRNYSDLYLYDRFMRNENVIANDYNEQTTKFIDMEQSVYNFKEKISSKNMLRLEKRGERPEMKTVSEMTEEDFDRFFKNALSELRYKNEVTINRLYGVPSNEIVVKAEFSHNDDLKPTHYYRRFNSLYRLFERFGFDTLKFDVEVLVGKEADKLVAENYSKRGLEILNRELNKATAPNVRIEQKNDDVGMTFGGRALAWDIAVYNTKLNRYFAQEME